MAIKAAPPTERFKLGLAAGPNLKGMPLKRRFNPGKFIKSDVPQNLKKSKELVHVPFKPGPAAPQGPIPANVVPNKPALALSARQHAPRLQAALEARRPMLALTGPSSRPAIAGRAPMRELANPRRKAVEQKFVPFGELGPGKAEPKISKEAPRHGSSRAAGIKPEFKDKAEAPKPKTTGKAGGTPPPKAEGPKAAGPKEGPKRDAPKASEPTGDFASHYGSLGLKPGANLDAVRTAFRKKAKEHHPDMGGDAEKFKEINAAYRALKGSGLK